MTHFLENLFIYLWTFSVGDLKKLNETMTPEIKLQLQQCDSNKILFEKYTQLNQEEHLKVEKSHEISPMLPMVSAIIFLRSVIMEINETGTNYLEKLSFEELKVEYAQLRVELLNKIKYQISKDNNKSNIDFDSFDEIAQRRADQYEDKFYEISNNLGYQFLRYKNSTLVRWVSSKKEDMIVKMDDTNFSEVVINPIDIN
tara:strand:+ start:108 stop:707 length:600 start_codon:yes stop_codon:yes gene_type:complete